MKKMKTLATRLQWGATRGILPGIATCIHRGAGSYEHGSHSDWNASVRPDW